MHPVRSLLPFLAVALACAPSTSYRRAVPLTPSLHDTVATTWEGRVADVLAGRGYALDADTATPGLRAERPRNDGRDVIHVQRAAERFGGEEHTVRFEYRIRAHSVYADRAFGSVRPEARADVDDLTAELTALREAGGPAWVAGLTCAMTVARDEGFRVLPYAQGSFRPDAMVENESYWSPRGDREAWPQLTLIARDSYRPEPGTFDRIIVAPGEAEGVRAMAWPPETPRVQAVRDRIVWQCGPGNSDQSPGPRAAPPPLRSTDASASG